ncbi:hypothetical protein [Actinomadura rubrisoli]|uniref:Uncharacterized protein n=1 Tax=Actinomadura rubrisoli TaxID=2530368 RepID=A0A4R5B8W6_9ACTN|nr:hypothetical protein [Actinomadura rubrisoli]TDD81905.1 hypothetical protein E1298_23515 [Actinomadura rubrisoli]
MTGEFSCEGFLPGALVEFAAGAFREAMRLQRRRVQTIDLVTSVAERSAVAELVDAKPLPLRDAADRAMERVSHTVRRVLEESGHRPGTITEIRDAAQARFRRGLDNDSGAWEAALRAKPARPNGHASGDDGPDCGA